MRYGIVLAIAMLAARAQTQIDLRTQAKSVDFSGAASTKPLKTGTALPVSCATGEVFFKTSAPAGANFFACTAANTWSVEGGGGGGNGALAIESNGALIGSRGGVNLIAGTGIQEALTDTGSQINVQTSLDSAVVQTQPGEQSGAVLVCSSVNGNANTYQCAMNPTVSAYTTGMVLHWIPNVNGGGGATTLNIDTLGATPVKMADGATNPSSTDIVAGRLYLIWYDGTVFRIAATTTGSGGGTNGNTILTGTSAPAPSAGANGDFFLRTDTSCLYGPKASGAWPGSCTLLVGPQGTAGATGPVGPAPSGAPNKVLATDASGSSTDAAALRSLVLADLPAGYLWSNLGSVPTIPAVASTTSTLKGDGGGNAVPVTGTGSNCVHADGTTAACGGGSPFSALWTPPWGAIITSSYAETLAVANEQRCAEFPVFQPGLAINRWTLFTVSGTTDVGNYAVGFMDGSGNVVATSTTITGTGAQAPKDFTFGSPVTLTGGTAYSWCWSSNSTTTQFFAAVGDTGFYGQMANQGLAGGAAKVYTCQNKSTTVSNVTTLQSCGTRTALSFQGHVYMPGGQAK